MEKSQPISNIIVTGDVTVDWNIVLVEQVDEMGEIWNPEDKTRACPQRGGSALLADLIEKITVDLQKERQVATRLFQTGAASQPGSPIDPAYNHAYAVWDRFPLEKNDRKNKAWRVKQYMGLDRASTEAGSTALSWRLTQNDPDAAAVVVLDDANLGFRDNPELWPTCIRTPQNHKRPWVVLKTARPVAHGKLWDHLVKHFADHLITIVSVNDQRSKEDQISRKL